MKLTAIIFCILSMIGVIIPALIFFIAGAVIIGFIFLVPLIYMIPITVQIFKARKGLVTLSVALKICVLLFVSLIAGILLLCDSETSKTSTEKE